MSNTSLLGSYGAQDSSSLMFRNRLINGDMRIDQRNAGTQSNTSVTQYHVDRWNYLGTQVSKFSIQKSAVTPSGFTSSLLFTSLAATAAGASDWWAVRQVIEGFNVADLGWGTASAQSITLSFWVRSSLTGVFGGSLLNDAANRTYAFTYSISAANTWEYKTVTIQGDTSGTWLTDANAGIRLVYGLGAGSSSKTAAGSWTAGAFWGGATGTVDLTGTNGATLYITGVQLEAGPTATPFERRPYSVELGMCQRYYYRLTSSSLKASIGTSGAGSYYAFANSLDFMRTKTPTRTTNLVDANYVSTSPTGSQWTFINNGLAYGIKTGTVTVYIENDNYLWVKFTNATFSQYDTLALGPTAYLDASAEL